MIYHISGRIEEFFFGINQGADNAIEFIQWKSRSSHAQQLNTH